MATTARNTYADLIDVLAAWMHDHDRDEDSPDYPDSPNSAIYREYVSKRMPDLAANHLAIVDLRTQDDLIGAQDRIGDLTGSDAIIATWLMETFGQSYNVAKHVTSGLQARFHAAGYRIVSPGDVGQVREGGDV